eukprot:2433618-Amphidinium_carterae.1
MLVLSFLRQPAAVFLSEIVVSNDILSVRGNRLLWSMGSERRFLHSLQIAAQESGRYGPQDVEACMSWPSLAWEALVAGDRCGELPVGSMGRLRKRLTERVLLSTHFSGMATDMMGIDF